MKKKVIITGGAGFIGSALIRHIIKTQPQYQILNLDKLTYAGNLASLAEISDSPNYRFVQGDICDSTLMTSLFQEFRPMGIIHLAAESHVDRSIDGPKEFIDTNILGTYTLLEATRGYLETLEASEKSSFRFQHISTDEVFGSLGENGFFTETTPYQPRSPYSASKAASDHLVRAWHHTFGVPILLTNCSNNYGPYQFPEKLIPLVILNALEGKPLPIYGKGDNVRDWLFVDDHADALLTVFEKGHIGESYNIGGHNEQTNLSVVKNICQILDELQPRKEGNSYSELIKFVFDRPGHDHRYAIDASFIGEKLNWRPKETFASGLKKTVSWYLQERKGWCEIVQEGKYQRERLGTKK